ncbi:protein FAR1-RELATED SEQUENCE 5-like [Salvia hispanica]|uniref:protein FAR1-RELATED SEQUENCE 5-like n=1 Tax=Salvia hispanica TaxID=49212 RepID=UPI002009CDD4|nr:protein FAR1-RELATED SEQUENCE 5-like [Salvia hispanica]
MGENMNDQLYIPQIANDRKPEIGMKFTSIDDAFEFYNQYAREAGFSARISNSKRNKITKEVVWKQFVCFKAGQTDEARSKNRPSSGCPTTIRARGEVRTDCKAKISIVRQQNGPGWCVSVFTEGHNHGLSTPSKVHLLRSHRSVSAAKKVLTQHLSEANIPTCQQMQLLEIESGGLESVGCTERDIRNFEKKLRDEQKGIDAETLIEFFTSEKEKNSAFFFDYETYSDSDNTFKRCFWADYKSRRAYSVFGDVVVFDSTYNTNKFMEAMPTGAPKSIITDQDPAMTKALAQVLPETVHRYCLWHILNKFPEKISPVTFRDHYRSIKNVIKNSTSPEEFEHDWKDVIRCANLEENSWIVLMYELRHKWVPTYFSNVFFAGMSSSQKSESSHSFFKKYVSHKNSLMPKA